MKVGMRKPSIKKSVSARTTGRITRTAKRAVDPLYGKKGVGAIKNPKKAVYNKVYKKTTVGIGSILDRGHASSEKDLYSNPSYQADGTTDYYVTVTNDNILQIIDIYPEALESIKDSYISYMIYGFISAVISIFLVFLFPVLGFCGLCVSAFLFYGSYKRNYIYNDAILKLQNQKGAQSYNQMKESNYQEKRATPGSVLAAKTSKSSSHNMNATKYRIKAKYSETNRYRTREIYVMEGETIEEALMAEGFIPPAVTAEEIPYEKPNESQIYSCKRHGYVYNGVCFEDVCAILIRGRNKEKPANIKLFEYATKRRVVTTYYNSSEMLHCKIMDALNLQEKIIFFIFCVYRDYMGDSNLEFPEESEYYHKFERFAKKMSLNEEFIKSFNHFYAGGKFRSFGNLKEYDIDGSPIEFGAATTKAKAYKLAIDYLKNNHIIP